MAIPHSVDGLRIGNHVFPPALIPPASGNTLFLGGAGVRGLEIENKFIIFTIIGIYLQSTAIPSLSVNWKGKTAQELSNSSDFYRDIYAGPFEKLTQVMMILPLTGRQYSEKVAENCVTYLREVGSYSDAENKAIKKFLKIFKKETFAPASSILFTHSPHGSLHIAFSKNASIPRVANATIVNRKLCEAVLESIIGKNGVSPQAKQSLAERLSTLLGKVNVTDSKTPGIGVKQN